MPPSSDARCLACHCAGPQGARSSRPRDDPMQNSAWIVLLRRIPPDQHNSLAIVTSVGIEINIQNLVRIEDDHVVIRGRLAGTTDTGRAFFVPYNQINYLGIVREVKEPQLRALYGEAPPAQEAEQKS